MTWYRPGERPPEVCAARTDSGGAVLICGLPESAESHDENNIGRVSWAHAYVQPARWESNRSVYGGDWRRQDGSVG